MARPAPPALPLALPCSLTLPVQCATSVLQLRVFGRGGATAGLGKSRVACTDGSPPVGLEAPLMQPWLVTWCQAGRPRPAASVMGASCAQPVTRLGACSDPPAPLLHPHTPLQATPPPSPFTHATPPDPAHMCPPPPPHPHPHPPAGEIGVPPYFATRLSFPEPVTPWNVELMRQASGREQVPGGGGAAGLRAG